MKTEIFTAADGKAISLKIWDEASEPRMVLQLVHGMAEHVSRYNDFAEYLNSCGIIVAGDDHRAHGDTDPDALGLAGEGDLFHKTVEDEKGITALLKERYGLPVVIMGHSYGSFLTQRYISLGTSDIAGCILMGSAAMEGFVVNVGARIAAKKMKKGEKDARGKFFADVKGILIVGNGNIRNLADFWTGLGRIRAAVPVGRILRTVARAQQGYHTKYR